MPNAQYRRIDFYRQFGLKDFADIEEVKKRYRSLVLKYHPDRGGNEEKMKIVSESMSQGLQMMKTGATGWIYR